jgi:HEAT repeat protein
MKEAAYLARRLGKEGIKKLGELLKSSESAAERFTIAMLLEELADPAAIPYLSVVLGSDSDTLVRRGCSHALAMIGTEQIIAPLLQAINNDADMGVRINSAFGLARINRQEGKEFLIQVYQDKNNQAFMRLAACQALSMVADRSMLEFFRQVRTEEKDIGYQLWIIQAYQKIGTQEVLPELLEMYQQSTDQTVREAARKAYNNIAGEELLK